MFNDRFVVDLLEKSRNDVNENVCITKINCENVSSKYISIPMHLPKYNNLILQYVIQESFTHVL